MIRVAVTGGRDHEPTSAEMARFWKIWDDIEKDGGRPTLLHGDARGVDRFVAAAVYRRGYKVLAFPAQWAKLGRAAGMIRNDQMMRVADALIAFPGGRGTGHCVGAARREGKTIYYIREGD